MKSAILIHAQPFLRVNKQPPRLTKQRRRLISMADTVSKTERISCSIRGVPNFPKPGILFWDITTLLLDPVAFQDTLDLFIERYRPQNIEGIAGNSRVRISIELALQRWRREGSFLAVH